MHAILRSNSLRLVVLVWFSGWLLMVIPGHKRGIVTLPGSEIEQAQAESQPSVASCCEPKPSCCDLAASDCEKPPKPIDPAKHCAICFLKSHMTDPPAVVLYTPYLGELDELVYLAESSILDDVASPTRVRGRAPPV